MRSHHLRVLGWAFTIAAMLLLAVAVIYFSEPARNLPSLLGKSRSSLYRRRRGEAAAMLTVLCWLGAILAFRARSQRLRRRHRKVKAVSAAELGIAIAATGDAGSSIPQGGEDAFDEVVVSITAEEIEHMRQSVAMLARRHSRPSNEEAALLVGALQLLERDARRAARQLQDLLRPGPPRTTERKSAR